MYSALDGFATPKEIAERITELGLSGAFLTDHGTVAGLSKFGKVMAEHDLFAGYGMEAYHAKTDRRSTEAKKMGEDMAHLVLLAQTQRGYKNLMRLSDESNRTGFYYRPRVDAELLREYSEGIIATSACMASWVCQDIMNEHTLQPLNEMLRIFGDNFYIELHTYATRQQRDLNERLYQIAREKGIPVVYANDAHYAIPDDYEYHEAFLCAQYNSNIHRVKSKQGETYHSGDPTRYHPDCLYIMDEADVRAALDYLPAAVVDEAIANSDAIAEMCKYDLPAKETHMPVFKSQEDDDTTELLMAKVAAGMEERYDSDDQVAWDRAEYELRAIIGAGLGDYFLIVADYVNHALANGHMVGPGRGSVGGSILAYALGITTIDPLKYGLQFARFWNPGRSDGMPDIDVDFSCAARLLEIEYVKTKYGEDKVLPIGNHMLLWPKSAIDKAGMVLYDPPPYGVMTNIKKIIEGTTDAGKLLDWGEMWDEVGGEFDKYLPQYHDLFEFAAAFCGRVSTYGQHASAVVISDGKLAEYLPARQASEEDDKTKKVLVTQAEMHQVEEAGFPKFDFLGLRNLDVCFRAAELTGGFASAQEVVSFYREATDFDAMPEEAWALIDKGLTLGLFQIEVEQGARRLAKQIRPRSIEDLAVLVALNRPGPLRSGDAERYIKRRNGQEAVSYPHEILSEILEPTYGVFLYQEQVIAYFSAIGYDESEADHIRKIMGKKLVEQMRQELPKYLEQAEQYMTKAQAMAIWELIVNYSKYGFNKAHAVGYAMILAWTIYAKHHWPVEFIMAAIENNSKKVGAYVNEASRMDIRVRPPSISDSKATISKVGEEILYGFIDIKGIGAGAASLIVESQPYASPEDYFDRCTADKGVFRKLQRAGAFDADFGYRLEECPACAGKGRVPEMVPKKSGEGLKRVLIDCSACLARGVCKADLPSLAERADAEEELLGIVLTDLHGTLIETHTDRISQCDSYEDAQTEEETEVKIPGIVLTVQPQIIDADKQYNAGRTMAFVTIRWEADELRFVAFPDKYDDFRYMLKPRIVGEFTLKTGPRGAKLVRGHQYIK